MKPRTFLVLLILAVVSVVAAAPGLLDVRATLTGEVLEAGLARPGQVVRDGEPIVSVRTLVGSAVAARAPADGTIVEVLVRPGQVISARGIIVARLLPR